MDFTCETCHSELKPGEKACENCGTAFDVPVPSTSIPPPINPNKTVIKPGKLLIGCFGGAAVLLILLITLAVIATNGSLSPPTKATKISKATQAKWVLQTAAERKQEVQQASRIHQNRTHTQQTAYRGKMPAISRGPHVGGANANDAQALLRKAYPGCPFSGDLYSSSADTDQNLGYDVTLPNGHKVVAVFDFITDPGQSDKKWLYQSGHYEITEEPYLTPTQQASKNDKTTYQAPATPPYIEQPAQVTASTDNQMPQNANSDSLSPSTSPVLKSGVTMENYNQIQAGMSYEQVKEILGKDGTESVSSNLGGISTVIYEWKGTGLLRRLRGGNMNATFQNDKLVLKAQAGL